jgi:uncharacterized protein (TIGR02466 family)
MQENNIEFIPLINLGIFKFTLKDFNLEYWIKEIYNYKEKNPISVLKSNRGGWQSPEVLNNLPQFFPLCKLIQDAFSYIEPKPSNFINSMWVNISSFTNFNAPHCHGLDNYPYNLYSGVIYLKVPQNSGDIIFSNPLSRDLVLQISPIEGDILFFPSSLYHYVEPNLSQEDRISIAFNFN